MNGVQAEISTGAIRGRWVTLEPVTTSDGAELTDLERRRQLLPGLGGPYHTPNLASRYLPAMAVRDNQNGRMIGLLETGELIGYPGVAVMLVYVDPELARPGVAMEATGIYSPMIFDSGAAILHIEVLSFNSASNRIFQKRQREPQARLRQHIYVAGRFWDLLIYSFDRADWDALMAKLKRALPGGQRQIAALGGKPPST